MFLIFLPPESPPFPDLEAEGALPSAAGLLFLSTVLDLREGLCAAEEVEAED